MTYYTSKVVAAWLGVTERRVRQLRDEGVIEEAKPGLYNLRQCVTRYIGYIRKGNANLNDERAMLTRAKREAAEDENKLRRGEMHSTADVELGIKTMCLNIRSRMLSLPAKLAPALANAGGNQAAIFDELKQAIDEALDALKDYNVTFATPEGAGDEEND